MLSVNDLAVELEHLANAARDLGRRVKHDGDLPPRALAGGLVEAGKLGEKLQKLAKKLHGDNGKKRK